MSRRRIAALALALAATACLALAGALARKGVPAGLIHPRAAGPALVLPPAERAFPAPGAPLRLSVLGTSLSARNAWPRELAARLDACRPGGTALRVTARPGAGSRWGLGAAPEAAAPMTAAPIAADRISAEDGAAPPDVLLVEFAINDASLARRDGVAASTARMEAILDLAQAAGVGEVWLLTMSPAWGRERLERPGLDAYLDAHAARFRARGAGVVDTVPAWRALPPAIRAAEVPDGLHPTDAATRLVLVPALAEALAGRPCDAARATPPG